ncbi:MAG: class I SAM-dependent methyltransferase [Desulfovibrionaceae bacterium]|nr:class I SAM-dependent methyltransferase [Desulfovibrionaceae bacterium]MBF0515076.1 class I SAM-dependent methyltransferase [Desulfovibrionaceae bacterium]
MFHDLPRAMAERMAALEAMDAADRSDGAAHALRLRQIPPETGKFLAILAANAPAGDMIEVGASAGYSALWLSLACKAVGRRLITHEISPGKAELARETFRLAGVREYVELVQGDALALLPWRARLGFCFLDAERSLLPALFEIIVPRLVAGGLIAVDNVISHASEVAAFLPAALADPRLDSVVVPIGSGVLVCRNSGD